MTHQEPTNDPDILRRWIGRRETADDSLDARHARLMEVTLDREPTLGPDAPLPPLWHWIYFRDGTPLSLLGRDGHAARGGLLPPVALPRRMWAGSRVHWHEPLLLGRPTTRTTTVTAIEMKEGRSGPLCFVTLGHEISCEGDVCLREDQDLVFREDPDPSAAPAERREPPTGAEWSDRVEPSPVQLFRYSALTFNGHRIHYDRSYVTDVEGYPGLVVHGPLTATLLADLACRQIGPHMRSFEFRAVAPLFDTAPFSIYGRPADDGADLWALTPEGGLAMRATAAW